MNLFIGIRPSEEMIEELIYNIEDLQDECEKGSFTDRENLVLQLVNLENIQKEDIGYIREAMQRAVMNFDTKPMVLELGEVGSFGRKGKVDRTFFRYIYTETNKRVIVNQNGVRKTVDEDRLGELFRNLIRELSYSGIEVDGRRFEPKIIIGVGCRTFRDFDLESFENNCFDASMEAKELSLIEYVYHGPRTIYRPIYNLKL